MGGLEVSRLGLKVVPPAFPYSQEEDGAAEGQLRGHGYPHASQAKALREPPSQGEAHAPHGEKAHGGWFQGVAGCHANRIANYCGGEERLGKGFYAQDLSAKVPDFVNGREEANHLRSEDEHHHSHESHHDHARAYGEVGEVVAQAASSRAVGLTDERRGGIANAIARHIAEALGGDGKRVGGNGGIAQWRHDEGGHHLRRAHEDILHGYWQTYLGGVSNELPSPNKLGMVEVEGENLVFPHGLPRHGDGGKYIRGQRAEGGARNAQAENVDKQVVECHVEAAHHYGQRAGHSHLARAFQHGSREVINEHGGQREAEDEEISRRHWRDVGLATKPERKPRRHGGANERHEHAEAYAAHQCVAENLPGVGKVVGSDEVGNLHGETHRHGGEDGTHKPCGGLYQADACRLGGAEMSHHGGIDEEHHHGGYLRKHRWNAQVDDEAYLLASRHLLAVAYLGKQYVTFLHVFLFWRANLIKKAQLASLLQ